MYQLKVRCLGQLQPLYAAVLLLLNNVLLPNDGEVRLVSQKRKHDEVGVRSVEAVSRVRVVGILES